MIKKFGDKDVHPNESGRKHYVSCNNWICDYESEVGSLPNSEKTAIGSMALVIETGSIYILSSNGWVAFGG